MMASAQHGGKTVSGASVPLEGRCVLSADGRGGKVESSSLGVLTDAQLLFPQSEADRAEPERDQSFRGLNLAPRVLL